MRNVAIALVCLGIVMTSNPVFSAEIQDYSKIWETWGRDGQTAYIWGFIDGSTAVSLTAMEEYISLGKGAPKAIGVLLDNTGKKTATLFDEHKLIDVISNLYKDPANSYILFGDMVYIARDSLSGKDVTKAILKARNNAIATHELNEKMKAKEAR